MRRSYLKLADTVTVGLPDKTVTVSANLFLLFLAMAEKFVIVGNDAENGEWDKALNDAIEAANQ